MALRPAHAKYTCNLAAKPFRATFEIQSRGKMKWKHTFCLIGLWSLTAQAVCVNGHPSVTSEFRQSKAVVVATVVGEKRVPDAEDRYFLDGTMYEVRVDMTFKTGDSAMLQIFSENTTGRFDMVVGGKYLLFIYEEHGRLRVDNCGNSGAASKKSGMIQQVARLAHSSN